MANPPNIRIRGIRSPIPQGYVLGRTSSGQGDVELIDIVSLGQQIAASSGSSTSGSAVLPVSGVTAGSYRCTNLTVTDKGIITAASDGGMLPLVTGDTFFGMPVPIENGSGDYIGVYL